MKLTEKDHFLWWVRYQHHVKSVILPYQGENVRHVSYWRNEIFCSILTYITPLSLMALIPGVLMAIHDRLPVIALTDLFAFSGVVAITMYPGIKLETRKSIFIVIMYALSVILIFNLNLPAPGLLFLLTITIFSSLIYHSTTAYYTAWINTIICLFFALLIYFKVNMPLAGKFGLGMWIAVSSNLILLSFVCAKSLQLVLYGMQTSIRGEIKLEANLVAIIDSTDANIYSLDREFRYITFNKALKNNMKLSYDIDIKPGDLVFDFLEKSEPEELDFWSSVYVEALLGKSLQFEKTFRVAAHEYMFNFSLNPIIENKKIIGLSCFAVNITEKKNEERAREMITNDLILRNKNMEQFSYIVSHNLRSPVANILGFAELLKLENSKPTDLIYMAQGMTAAAYKLDDVIRDLNTILQIKSPLLENKEPVYFQELVNDISLSIDHIIKGENVIIRTDFKSVDTMLSIKSYLYSVFYNLIRNSIKYHRPKVPPVIEITSQCTVNGIKLVFRDNGLGIDLAKNKEKLFGLYKRFHFHKEGKGMGLFMVKTQLETLGGKIAVTSEVDQGTEFVIEFENTKV